MCLSLSLALNLGETKKSIINELEEVIKKTKFDEIDYSKMFHLSLALVSVGTESDLSKLKVC